MELHGGGIECRLGYVGTCATSHTQGGKFLANVSESAGTDIIWTWLVSFENAGRLEPVVLMPF